MPQSFAPRHYDVRDYPDSRVDVYHFDLMSDQVVATLAALKEYDPYAMLSHDGLLGWMNLQYGYPHRQLAEVVKANTDHPLPDSERSERLHKLLGSVVGPVTDPVPVEQIIMGKAIRPTNRILRPGALGQYLERRDTSNYMDKDVIRLCPRSAEDFSLLYLGHEAEDPVENLSLTGRISHFDQMCSDTLAVVGRDSAEPIVKFRIVSHILDYRSTVKEIDVVSQSEDQSADEPAYATASVS